MDDVDDLAGPRRRRSALARPAHPRPAHPRPAHRWLRLALKAAGLGALVLVAVAVALWVLTPSVGDARQRVAGVVARQGGTALGALPSPDRVGLAVVATEDRRFFSHPGIDVVALGRVATGGFRGGGDQGGATLDQQLAKQLYGAGRTGIWAEVEQVVLGVKLDRAYSKDDILRMYLDAAYFGNGYYGLVAAAAGYFGATPAQLTWAQASLLAGVLPAPSDYDPVGHPDVARGREQHVLDRLVTVGTLTRAEAQAAFDGPVGLRPGLG